MQEKIPTLESLLSDIRKFEKTEQILFPLTMKRGHCFIPTNGVILTASCPYHKIIVRIPRNVKLQSMTTFYCA